MRRRFASNQPKFKPSGVQSLDTPKSGLNPKKPIQFANVPGSLELDRKTFRECIGLIKEKQHVTVENVHWSHPSSFIYFMEGSIKPFAVASYPQNSRSQYFILIGRISKELQNAVRGMQS